MSELPGLILVEGLPGAGKSTTSHLLSLHLERHGVDARWYYEHDQSHPIFQYPEVQEVLDHGRLREGLFEDALEKWRRLAESLSGSRQCIVLESSFLQTAIHPMLLMDWGENRIVSFALEAERAIRGARAVLVWLRHADAAAALQAVSALRGCWFMEFLVGRVSRSRYGMARKLEAVEGALQYARNYQALVDRILDQLRLPVLTLPVDVIPKSDFVNLIADFIGLPQVDAFVPESPDARAFVGIYQDTGSEDRYSIVTDGAHLFVDGTPPTRLIRRGTSEFELLGTCVRFKFLRTADGSIRALDCRGSLPGLAPEWVKQ